MWVSKSTIAIAITSLFFAQSAETIPNRGVWRAECRLGQETPYQVCEVIGEFRASISNQEIVLMYDVGEERFLHVGHPHRSNVAVQVDVRERIQLYLCTELACLLRGKDAQHLLQQMRTGSVLKIDLDVNGDSSTTVAIPLEGFEATYQRALSDHGSHRGR